MNRSDNRSVAEKYCRALPADFDVLASLQHPEFVQEFPQSGETIRGSDNFRKVHENYPGGSPGNEVRRVTGTEDRWTVAPTFTLVRLTGVGDTFTAESSASYPDGSQYQVVTILEIRDAKVFRARTYFAPEFEPPGWRAEWVELAPST